MLSWMLYTLVITASLGIAALAIEWIARAFAFPTRIVWCAALVAGALASVASWRASSEEATSIRWMLGAAPSVAAVQSTERAARARTENSVTSISVTAALSVGWLSLSVLTAGFLVLTTVQLSRRQRSWTRARVAGEAVLVTDGLGPAVVGFFSPVIALPAWTLKEQDDRVQLIVAHEREHLRAGDQRVIALAWIVAIALPWNFIVVWMIARLRHAIEIDCDARVIRRHRDVRGYGELLIDVSRRPASMAAGLTAFAERPSNVERRIMALTTGMPRHGKIIAACLSAVAVVVLFGACEIPRPAGPGAKSASAFKTAQPALTEVNAPLPAGVTPTLQNVLARDFSAVNARGTKDGEAVWFVADRDGSVRSSWIGNIYSESEFRRAAMRQAFDTLHLVAFIAGMKATNGSPINVVWTKDQVPWEISELIADRTHTLIRDSIRVLQPALYSGLASGDAVYFVLDWKNRRVERIWSAPALSDRKAQWEYARGQFSERVVLHVTNVNVTIENGRVIPVVYLNRRPWAERY
jgi:beta-lactamase regulating signal transducer with metallopeptidase domain